MREVLLPGPAGRLEALIAAPRAPRSPAGFCVVCHPHPLFGGAMTNKVAYTLASSALQAGLVAVRFNFRGVGRSEGQYSDARGETDDVLAVVEWMRARMPGAPVALAGFSFGAYVSLKAAATVHPVLQISVSVPVRRHRVRIVPGWRCTAATTRWFLMKKRLPCYAPTRRRRSR
jgi:alpha/beta superfamily hydrolase